VNNLLANRLSKLWARFRSKKRHKEQKAGGVWKRITQKTAVE
jgi:hypothetical protein